ncbi:MAG: hypothetical protein J6C55_01455 [Oscillospiraceae bacterium]|nr:hypothetical protein [Oscillospiraceae bacterium]
MKKKAIKFTSSLICFILTLCLFLTFVFVSIGFNFRSKSLNKYISSSGYSNGISEKILDKLYNLADTNNLPHEIFDNFVNADLMASDIYDYMVSISSQDSTNSGYIKNINNKKQELTKKVKDYVISNIKLSDRQLTEIDKNIETFVDECILIYKNNIKSNILETAFKYIKFIDKYFVVILLILIFIDIIIILVLINSQSWKHRGYRYSLYSLISCELMLTNLISYISLSNIINRLNILSKELNSLVVEILNNCLFNLYISEIILFVLIGFNIYFYKKEKKKVL